MKKLLYLSILLFGVSSCMKEEIPVPSHTVGNVTTNQIELGTNYRYQAYYDFGTNSFVKKHEKIEWDLGFETGESGWRVITNTSKAMAIAAYPLAEYSSVTDTIGAQWMYDVHSGNMDSTAVGNWQSGTSFYLVNRGFSFDGTHQGFRKLKLVSVSSEKYEVHFSNLDGFNEQSMYIEKDHAYNFTFLSFIANSVVDIQPPKDAWDMVFGQYAFLFEPTFPYIVTGILSNRNGVEVAEVFDKSFDNITFEDVSNYSFSEEIDIIGYDWKTFTGGTYITHTEKNYVVKTTEEAYYKIHFIEFYSPQGEKGTPQFEVQAL